MEKKVFKISDEEIKQRYLEGESLNDIAKVALDTKGLMALRNKLHELGVNTSRNMRRYRYKLSRSCKRYALDDTVFSTIDTLEKAYWLGFIMADGYNHESKGCISIRIHELDIEILEKFKRFLKTDSPIHTYSTLTRVNRLNRTYCDISVYSPVLSESLSKLGCVLGKTYSLEFPNIPWNLLSHFIRGYFDGDGCISITPRKDRKEGSRQYQLNFVGKESVILKIQDIICSNTGVFRTKLRNKSGNFAKCISWSGRIVCKRILEYLYKDSIIHLNRKYNKYLELGNPAE